VIPDGLRYTFGVNHPSIVLGTIIAVYYQSVAGEPNNAIETYREWKESYPRDEVAQINFCSLYAAEGRYELGIAQAQQSLRLNPDNVITYDDLSGWRCR
jgi:tetratricopeptide (TPR) repeat protein